MQKKHTDFGNNFFYFSKTSDGCKNALEAIFSESLLMKNMKITH